MLLRTQAGLAEVGKTDGLAFAFVILDSNFNPANADAAPQYAIYSTSGLATGTPMANGTGTAAAVSGETGVYYIKHTLNPADGYVEGEHYHVVISYSISTVPKRAVVDFVAT